MARDLRNNDYVPRRQTDDAINEAINIASYNLFDGDMPSKTIQGPAAEAEINYIARMYGLDPFSRLPVPVEAMDPRYYGDLSEVDTDLQTAMNRVFEAQANFMKLPAALRARFNHSPGELWTFLQDESNHAEAVELGILFKPPAPPKKEPLDTPPPA